VRARARVDVDVPVDDDARARAGEASTGGSSLSVRRSMTSQARVSVDDKYHDEMVLFMVWCA